MVEAESGYTGQEIAVTGLSVRVNNAANCEEFWDKLKNGVELISFYSDEELLEAGQSPESVRNPDYVKAGSILEDKEYFDAAFFGYTPREAELLDPQVRIFHECSWQALEDAGIDPEVYPGLIGVYAGAVPNLEWEARVLLSGKNRAFGSFAASRLTGIRYLCTRLSFNLNLKGPSINIQTACSTSLTAIHLACQALLSGECDVAIAGGVTVSPRGKQGYIYQEHLIFSRDGHNRTFNAEAGGTIFGEGAGAVILKPLDDALAGEDYIYAVIRSSAVNNDGSRKVGFTAPSVESQVEMMRAAYHLAGIEPETIDYVEAHGTATELGDPIEIEALRQAFESDKKGFCRIGSVKSNLGHLDAAAGVAGFIKTVLSLKNKEIPPSLHFKTANPELKLDDSPFVVNTELIPWQRNDHPRRAAVNSLGMGGTNAHVVLEEAPPVENSSQGRNCQLLLLSAKSSRSLDMAAENLAGYFKKDLLNPGLTLADAAYTLQSRRKRHPCRRTLVCTGLDEAVNLLSSAKSRKIRQYYSEEDNRKVVFMFPGQGTQYVNMGLDLYRGEEVFRKAMDRCFEIIKPLLGFDIKDILYPVGAIEKAKEEINKILVTPAAVFSFEYALAGLLMDWGLKPDAMIGYSFGEYTAACLAGVFSLEDALEIITFRNRLMDELPPGIMMSVPLPADQLQPLLPDNISLAIDNGQSCIVSGPAQAVEAFEKELKNKKLICQRVVISAACHSGVMDAISGKFSEKVRRVITNKPQIPVISNYTGSWLTGAEAVDPAYWTNHLRHTVRFADGVKELLKEDRLIFLEVGPGNVLGGIVSQYTGKNPGINIINLVKHPHQDITDTSFLLDKIGQLWLYGQTIDGASFYKNQKRHCIPLPTYAFDRQRYRIEEINMGHAVGEITGAKRRDLSDWFYTTSWSRAGQLILNRYRVEDKDKFNWLIFLDDSSLDIGASLAEKLGPNSRQTVTVRTGDNFANPGDGEYVINPANNVHYRQLLEKLDESGIVPEKIIHLLGITDRDGGSPGLDPASITKGQNRGFYSLLYLAQAISGQDTADKCEIIVITNDMQKVTGDETISPIKSTVLGPVYVIPQEHLGIDCRSIDISIPDPGSGEAGQLTDQLALDLLDPSPAKITAYRKGQRWKQSFERIKLSENSPGGMIKEEGVYLITGGLGGVGFTLAEELAKSYKARLVLIGRSKLTEGDEKGEKIRQLREIGSQVLYFSADAADFESMQRVIARVEEKFGTVNGIIHAAGGTKGESIAFMRHLDQPQCEHQFKAKINGLVNLDRLFRDRKPDFLILTSSMTSFLGGWEYAAYSAANFFMDNFVLETGRWISVNLDPVNLEGDKNVDTTLSTGELIRTFKTLLANVKTGQILVSLSDLHDRIEKAAHWLREAEPGDDKGKKDRRERPHLTTPYVPPTDNVESKLVEICRELFGYEKIGVLDHFLELGGNSLILIKYISEIHKKFAVKLQIHDVFTHDSIRELAGYIKKATREKYISIEPAEKKEYYVLSSAQKRLYIIDQLEEEYTGYNIPWFLQFQGALDKGRLAEAFRQMIRRHESFRASFHLVTGEPVQKIHEDAEFEIEYYDGEPGKSAADIFKRFVRPFDLKQAPLLRVGLMNSGEHYILMLDMHHIIYDWTSQTIFTRDFISLYAGDKLPFLKLQYRDFAEWRNRKQQQEAARYQEKYWLQQFKGEIPVLNLPTDLPKSVIRGFDSERYEFEIDPRLTDEITKLLPAAAVTLFMMLSAVYTTLLFIYSGQEDIVVGSPAAGRNHEDLRDILGMFVNLLPMRNYPRAGKTFREFLSEVKENSLRAFENQDYPLEDLLSKLDLPRHLNRNPLVETLFTLQNAGNDGGMTDNNEEPGNVRPEPEFKLLPYEIRATKFDLTLDAIEKNGSLNMCFTYSSQLFKKSTIKKVKRHYIDILKQVVENIDIKLGDITISHDLAAAGGDILLDDQGEFGF